MKTDLLLWGFFPGCRWRRSQYPKHYSHSTGKPKLLKRFIRSSGVEWVSGCWYSSQVATKPAVYCMIAVFFNYCRRRRNSGELGETTHSRNVKQIFWDKLLSCWVHSHPGGCGDWWWTSIVVSRPKDTCWQWTCLIFVTCVPMTCQSTCQWA